MLNIPYQSFAVGHITLYFSVGKPHRIHRTRQLRPVAQLITQRKSFKLKWHGHIQTLAATGHKMLHRLIKTTCFTQRFSVFEIYSALHCEQLMDLRR